MELWGIPVKRRSRRGLRELLGQTGSDRPDERLTFDRRLEQILARPMSTAASSRRAVDRRGVVGVPVR